jgi:hypothetical protein
VANKAARLERIRAAKATLEAEAKKPPPQDDDGPGPSSGMMKSGKPERAPDGGPPDRAQRNFTDPDSRIQPMRSGAVIAGYNAQAAVDGAHQIIALAERIAHGRHGDKAQARRSAQSLPRPKADRRARVRPDQACTRLPPISPPWPRQGQSRGPGNTADVTTLIPVI